MAAHIAALADLNHRPFLHSRDEAERMVEVAVAKKVAERREKDRHAERRNLAIEVGNIVGEHVSAALQSIARAMRG